MHGKGGFRILYMSFAPFFSPLIEFVRESMPHLTRTARGFAHPSQEGSGHPALRKKEKKKKNHHARKR